MQALQPSGNPNTGGVPNYGVWISREEWKRQQTELKRGAEAYNQLLQDVEKKDREIERLRVSAVDASNCQQASQVKSEQLHAEVEKVHGELQEWQRLIEHQRAAISLQETKVEEAGNNADIHLNDKEIIEARCAQLEEELAIKDKTVAHLHAREQNAVEQIRAVEHLHHRSQKSVSELEVRCQSMERHGSGMADQLSERMAEINSLYGLKKQQRSLQGEVDRLRNDNARLVKMLSSTAEYREFVQRSYEQSEVAYIEHGSPLVDLRIITEDYGSGQDDRPLGDPNAELAHWIPADIYHYAQECRKRYLSGTADDSFGNFMHAMHLRWRAHEQRVMNKRELSHDREKTDLLRQIEQRKPYDVARLESDNRALRAAAKRGAPSFGATGIKGE
jgi:hypothetical protein